MNARTGSSGTSAIHISTQPQTTYHVNKSVDFFCAPHWMASSAPCFLTWVTPPTPQVSTQQPHRHYIYKYVAGGSGSVLSGNNIRPFKYIQVVGSNLCHMGEGKVNKKKRIVHMWGGGTTLFFKKEPWTKYVNKNQIICGFIILLTPLY